MIRIEGISNSGNKVLLYGNTEIRQVEVGKNGFEGFGKMKSNFVTIYARYTSDDKLIKVLQGSNNITIVDIITGKPVISYKGYPEKPYRKVSNFLIFA